MKTKFKPGDRVVCIDVKRINADPNIAKFLVKNKRYVIEKIVYGSSVYLKGCHYGWAAGRFKLLDHSFIVKDARNLPKSD